MIKIENLLVRYKNFTALEIKKLEFEDGVAYGVVGENGAGKTTLFKSITNIIGNYIGDIYIDDVLVRTNNEILVNVGLVLDGMSVYANRSGWFNVRYFAGLRDCYDEAYVRELAQELEIYNVLDKKVKTYSYGMQKKLILLIAILSRPKILILDEPFRGLDFETVKWFKEYLMKLRDQGTTLLISSHIRNDLETLCQKVCVISRGQVVESLDLEAESKQMIRLIDTTNNRRASQIMNEVGFRYEIKDNKMRASLDQDAWSLVQTKLQEENITIIEMSKTSGLDDKMN